MTALMFFQLMLQYCTLGVRLESALMIFIEHSLPCYVPLRGGLVDNRNRGGGTDFRSKFPPFFEVEEIVVKNEAVSVRTTLRNGSCTSETAMCDFHFWTLDSETPLVSMAV